MVRVVAFGAMTDKSLTDWSWYFQASDRRGFRALEEVETWRGVAYDSFIWMELTVTQAGDPHQPYFFYGVGKGLRLSDGEVIDGRMTGLFCFERDATGVLEFGFHISGFDLSAAYLATAIAQGRAYGGGPLSERVFGGDDTFLLSPQADAVHGLKGRDLMEGRAGDDTLWGDQGDDTLQGGDGNDDLYADNTYRGFGDDRVLGGAGDDFLRSTVGRDSLYGGNGNDTLWSGGRWAVLAGGRGDDEITARGRHATIHPGRGETDIISDYPATFVFGAWHRQVNIHVSNHPGAVSFHITEGADSFDDLRFEDVESGVIIRYAQATIALDWGSVARLSEDQFIFG